MSARRLAAAVLASLLSLAACGTLLPPPEPTRMIELPAQPLIDIGLFDGQLDRPPEYGIEELADGSAVLVVDRGGLHQVRRIQHDGERWTALGGFDAPLIPAGERGPALARVDVGPDDGFDEPLTLVIGRIPNGPVQQLELSLDGEATMVGTTQPVTVLAFDRGTRMGDRYTTMDSGTHRFDVLTIMDPRLP